MLNPKTIIPDDKHLRLLMDYFQTIADGVRIQILHALANASELNVTALYTHLGMAQPTVSHHLTPLRAANLVTAIRRGKCVHYSLSPTWDNGPVLSRIRLLLTEPPKFAVEQNPNS